MKKISYILLGCLMVTSCLSLEEKPKGVLTFEAFGDQTEELQSGLLVGAYRALYGEWRGGFDGEGFFLLTAGGEDVVQVPVPHYAGFNDLTVSPENNQLETPWNALVRAISICSRIIGLTPSGEPNKGVRETVAQAHFLRALSYFFQTRIWGKVQLLTEDISTRNNPQVDDEAKIYELIVNDLKYAEANLPVSSPEEGMPTRGAAKGFLAKVYLTMAGWPLKQTEKYALARDKAEEVIQSGTYDLEPVFKDLWLSANKPKSKEIMFTFYGSSANGSQLHFGTRAGKQFPAEGGWGDLYSDSAFYENFPPGPRKDASFTTVFQGGVPWVNDGKIPPFFAKYRDAGPEAATFDGTPVQGSYGDPCVILLRYADVLLIYAEAANLAEGSPSTKAYEYLNKVRKRAGLSDLSGLTSAQFDNAVLAERNWELAFEFNRWFDLTRREKVYEVHTPKAGKHPYYRYYLPRYTPIVERSNGLLKQNEDYQ